MVRKMGGLPKFLVFNSGINSLGNKSIFAFYLLLLVFIHIYVFSCRAIDMHLVTFFMSIFQMELNNYPQFYLTKDGRLCSTG
jgi:hypothetical protein